MVQFASIILLAVGFMATAIAAPLPEPIPCDPCCQACSPGVRLTLGFVLTIANSALRTQAPDVNSLQWSKDLSNVTMRLFKLRTVVLERRIQET